MHFGDTLEKHIRFEERQLFNLLQETLTETELEEVRRAHQMKHEPDDAWADAFWK
jgi:hemerythrin-like domain-containing protein